MLGFNYYHAINKKYIVYFGTLFNDIQIQRADEDNQVTGNFQVPIRFVPRDKMIERIQQEPNELSPGRPAAIVLPRMSFEISGYKYDGNRKIGRVERIVRKNEQDSDRFKLVFAPAPYDVLINLYIYTKNTEDGLRIVEQILPTFQPELNAHIHLIPELDISHDTPIELTGVFPEDNEPPSFKERRMNIWKLTFKLKGQFYGPVLNKPIIKFANEDFFFGSGPTDKDLSLRHTRVTAMPGLTANGEPTSNATLSVNQHTIFVDDDWDTIVQQSGIVILG